MLAGWVAVGYLAFIIGSLIFYARYYRLQKRRTLQATEQFYPSKFGRDIYQSLAEANVPPKLARAALLGWAAEDVARLIKLNEAKVSLQNLGQNGLVGESLQERVLGTDKLIQSEVGEIVQAAENLSKNSGNTTMPVAQEIAQNYALRLRLEQLDSFREEFAQWTGVDETAQKDRQISNEK